jgi:hypothetical protein
MLSAKSKFGLNQPNSCAAKILLYLNGAKRLGFFFQLLYFFQVNKLSKRIPKKQTCIS